MAASLVRSYYARVAEPYDRTFARVVAQPNDRLTDELGIRAGERVLDLACGTGLSTLRMAELCVGGSVVAVDDSEEMLARARARFEQAGQSAQFLRQSIDDFLSGAQPASFDVITLRFALTYLDWHALVPRLPGLLRPGGRIGIATSLAGSLDQLQLLRQSFVRSPETAVRLFGYSGLSLSRSWRIFRALRAHFRGASGIRVPETLAQVINRFPQGSVDVHVEWDERRREWFANPSDLIDWVVTAGCVAQASVDSLAPDAFRFLHALFGSGLERFREAGRIPLDFRFAGVVVRRRDVVGAA